VNRGERPAALFVVCCALAACGATGAQTGAPSAASAARGAAAVPWLDAPASGQARAFTVAGVAACTASDLAVSVHVANPSYVGAGPKDVTSWEIDVSDIGPTPCFVGPSPDVSFYLGSEPLAIPKGAPYSGDIVYLAPGAAAAQPPFFTIASGEIDVNSCVLPHVDQVRVDFGNGLGTVMVQPGPAAGWGAPCPVAHESYFSELYGVSTSGSTMGYAASTQASLEAPSSASPGEDLHFLVTLKNTPMEHSSAAISPWTPNPTMTLDPCPTYHEEFEGIAGTFHSYRLNCAAARPIPFGGSETFAMSIEVPSGAEPGPATLAWSIDGSPLTYQTARSYLQIG
jgi:hypothetical protein